MLPLQIPSESVPSPVWPIFASNKFTASIYGPHPMRPPEVSEFFLHHISTIPAVPFRSQVCHRRLISADASSTLCCKASLDSLGKQNTGMDALDFCINMLRGSVTISTTTKYSCLHTHLAAVLGIYSGAHDCSLHYLVFFRSPCLTTVPQVRSSFHFLLTT